MNSANEEVHVNLVLPENTSSTENQELSAADNNANLNASTSKGAIPKNTSATKLLSSAKKSGKLNNNTDEPNLSCNHQLKERPHQNGFGECVSNQVPNPYSSDVENSYSSEIFWKTEKAEHEEPQFLTLGDLQTFNIPSASQYEKIKDNFNDYNLYRQDLHLSDSSNDENELLSISDDGCVYTFKGDQVADLPSSFFSLDIPLQPSPEISIQNRQKNNTSPEMDYLEMDFDPGPSGDADSDTGLNGDMDNIENLPSTSSYNISIQENKTVLRECETKSDLKNIKSEFRHVLQEQEVKTSANQEVNITTSSQLNNSVTSISSNLPLEFKPMDRPVSHQNAELITQIRSLKLPWLDSPNRYNSKPITREPAEHSFSLMSCSSEYNSPSDKENYVCYDNFNISKSCNSSPNDLTSCTKVRKVMLWSEEEAAKKQIPQIGVSACGATAVLNVLKALRFPISLPDKAQTFVKTRLRENSSPLLEYLLSRSVAGCTHEDIINGLSKASGGEIYSRFFHMYPERDFDLSCFLRFWMKNDTVPIATVNLQKCSNYKNSGTIPDAWHHQMIFGISSKGIHLTNPLECIEIAQIWPQLCSESVLLIKREDILARWNQKTDLPRLMTINHKSWRNLNVVEFV
ncbi:uncharacterized protein LOC108742406 isoform X2 [Agrilus planipennis]|uniref:Uncharacterized protein LOC108742406 isoform X2 n=1 Tax=Agrilus planipennis TaxID=224129 RepID=A0A1W4XK02_AGRPL|nr:uncharacterized protein LOC108742406 isoform X2 [Agrilus planipennis]